MKTASRKTRRPDPVLIRTKFSRPPSRPEFVERPRLLDRLAQAIEQHRIILVSAPPGFGKTTLATQWLERQHVPAAWLALDNSDSDPERFVRYLIAAIEDGTPQRLPKSSTLLTATAPLPFDYVCEVLVSELAAAEIKPEPRTPMRMFASFNLPAPQPASAFRSCGRRAP